MKSLPAGMQDYCEKKGRLYYAVKDLNAAGQTLYTDDAVEAARYNMEILYRRGEKKKKGGAEGGTK